MAKLPDFSKLTGKLDMHGIVKNVKSIITPGSDIPESAKDDPIKYKFLEITKCLTNLVELHTKQADELAKLDSMVGSLSQDILLSSESVAKKEEPKETTTVVATETAPASSDAGGGKRDDDIAT